MSKLINVEICLINPKSSYDLDDLKDELNKFLKNLSNFETVLYITSNLNQELAKSIQTIRFDEDLQNIPSDIEAFNYYFYHHVLSNQEEDWTYDKNYIPLRRWILPNKEFEGLYESLIYNDNKVKNNVFILSQSALILKNRKLDKNLVPCNERILLHSSYAHRGNGKRSLCKAVAQKLSIRLNSIYEFTYFIEITKQLILSNELKRSGRFIIDLFEKINSMAKYEPNCLLCILISKADWMSECVLNAIIIQLDQMKFHSNVIIFATSNGQEVPKIANKFNKTIWIRNFNEKSIYSIYISAIKNLIKNGVVIASNNELLNSDLFKEVVDESLELSGRCLRKIPSLAHSIIEDPMEQLNGVNLEKFLNYMLKVLKEKRELIANTIIYYT